MEEKTLLAFAKWMQSKDEKLAKVPVEQLAAKVAEAMKTQEGQKQLAPLFQQFQSEVSEIMRSGGKMDYAVKRMSGGGFTEEKQSKISDLTPELGHPMEGLVEYYDAGAIQLGKPAHRTLHPDGSITGAFGKIEDRLFAPKPEIRWSGNDPIRRYIWDDGRTIDTIYMIDRPTRTGIESRNGRASDEDVAKYRKRVNTGWDWKRNLWKNAYNSGLFATPEYIQLHQIFEKSKK